MPLPALPSFANRQCFRSRDACLRSQACSDCAITITAAREGISRNVQGIPQTGLKVTTNFLTQPRRGIPVPKLDELVLSDSAHVGELVQHPWKEATGPTADKNPGGMAAAPALTWRLRLKFRSAASEGRKQENQPPI